jgi:DNA modification methylase
LKTGLELKPSSPVRSAVETFGTGMGVFVLGDARDVLRELPDNFADSVVTDPPWGVGFDEYDDFSVFLDVCDELYRVMKSDSWLVFFFTPKRIYDIAPYLSRFSYRWIIPYVFAGSSHSRNPLGSEMAYSIIMVLAKGKPKLALKHMDLIPSGELPIVVENIREPQFKPTYTVGVILSMFSRPGDLVLDPFAGYGSIPLVCDLSNRRWLAIEIDRIKYEVARTIITTKKVTDIKRLKASVKAGKPEAVG